MTGKHFEGHWHDVDGNPAGGVSFGDGFTISWQNGPLGRGEDRKDPNGASVETVINAVKGRLEFFQDSPFACKANDVAIYHLEKALKAGESRTQDREGRDVEGTYGV